MVSEHLIYQRERGDVCVPAQIRAIPRTSWLPGPLPSRGRGCVNGEWLGPFLAPVQDRSTAYEPHRTSCLRQKLGGRAVTGWGRGWMGGRDRHRLPYMYKQGVHGAGREGDGRAGLLDAWRVQQTAYMGVLRVCPPARPPARLASRAECRYAAAQPA